MPNLTSVIVYETSTTRSIKFWILLFFQPLSIVCSLCMFYHMLASRTQRQLLANQIVFVMLIVSFLSVTIDLSITLDFLRQGFVFSQSHAFCYFWMFIDYVLYTQGMLLMAWASIERHILVFSIQKLRSKKQKFFLHYFPILFCIIYPLIFYIYMILSYPCQQSFDYKLILCGTPCFKQISFVLNSYDTMIHSFIPTVITIISSLTLLIRVVRHKRRIQGQLFSWRKQYRMSVQLLTIACLYVLMNTPPYTIIATVAMRYIRFLSIQTDFHPICSSKYVSPSYLLELYNNSTNVSSPLVTHYRTLAALCFLSKKFIEHKYHSFNQRELITVETLTNESFTIEIQSLVSSFIRQTKADYRRQLSFIMNSFSVNQILNLFMNSWNIKFSDAEHDYVIDTIPQQFPLTNCTCAISRQCQMKYTDDIRIGCFPYDGFRLSKHENQSLEKLNMDLFVTKWNNQTNYTNYFRICRPLECQYTESDRNNLLYIATNLLGIYGGLVTLLTVIVSQFLLAYKWWTTF